MKKNVLFLSCCVLMNGLFAQNQPLNDATIAKNALKKEVALIKQVAKADVSITKEPTPKVEGKPQRKQKKLNANAKENGRYIIISAVENKEEHTIKELVTNGINITVQDELGNSPLLLGVVQKLPISTLELLTNNMTVNLSNNIGETPLKIALKQNNQALVNYFLQNGAEKGNLFSDKIWLAIENNDMQMLQDIIQSKGNLSIIKNNETPLTYAIKNNKLNLIDVLVQGGANPMANNTEGDTPYSLVLKHYDMPLFRKMLNASPESIHAANSYGESILDLAFRYADETLIRELMQKGANFGPATQQSNSTPLMVAIQNKKPGFYFEFMGDGKVNQANSYGKTPMILAIENGDLNLVNELIGYGASVHDVNYLGNTPIGYAVANNQLLILNRLIEMGADVNRPNDFGSTPLMEAAFYNYPDMARVLIQHGANKEYRDMYGMSAKEIAEQFNNNEVLIYLY